MHDADDPADSKNRNTLQVDILMIFITEAEMPNESKKITPNLKMDRYLKEAAPLVFSENLH